MPSPRKRPTRRGALGPSSSTGLAAQIACVERELRRRHTVYPRQVRAGTLTPEQAQHELLTMASVLRTLRDTVSQHGAGLALEPQQEVLPYAPART